ncbi:YhgE/Pip domain-containing protein [Rhodoferax sp.]|uniref:YhgE/Pip domain-containing protein n=1 Tax=Rhodoferax sp. TaxID=50421 RepID=UPI0026345E72|nr:YhgE/Pip domain-containing protein [Rhodoferax sp.]MDD2926879.1 YhgE/Pip domain-containing protein [Rhodoferax sp.]
MWDIVRMEGRFFWRYPRLLLAAAVVALIPALYVLIYLASVWDPAAKTGDLPVAIVNLDRGLEYRQQAFNVGRDLAARLKLKPTFGYVDYTDESTARQQVRQGALAFALIVPADFSSNAVPGAQAGAGKLVIFTSEGNSYPSATLAKRFAEDLGREVNQSLNEQRWALVLADADGSQRSIQRLHEGLLQLRQGAKELATGAQMAARGADTLSGGATRVEQGVDQLASGARELGSGLRTMFDKRPRNSDLRRLEEGAQALLTGQEEFGRGLVQLQQGAQRLQSGVNGFREEADGSVFVATRIKEGLDQLGEGTSTLESGLRNAGVAQQKLTEGATQLHTGVSSLTTGLRSLNSGLRSMVTQLPDDARLDELTRSSASLSGGALALKGGTQKVTQGAQHLAGGLDLLEGALPASVKKIEGNAQGLATSVQPTIEVDAPVQNNGSGFAPNIIPGALWLGASLAAFLIHMRTLARTAAKASAWAKMAGKMVIPSGIVLLQALLVWVVVVWLLNVRAVQVGALALTLCAAAITFLLIVFALTRALGDAGKALALVFLAVQLSSSGGILPVELSGGLFAQISPYLPITWVVRALKATLFGAFEGDWQHPLQLLALAGVVSACLACFVGRWRYVRPSALRPALDL